MFNERDIGHGKAVIAKRWVTGFDPELDVQIRITVLPDEMDAAQSASTAAGAIDSVHHNARLNGLDNVETIEGDAFEALKALGFRVVVCKNKFANPTPMGYSDINLVVELVLDEGAGSDIACESGAFSFVADGNTTGIPLTTSIRTTTASEMAAEAESSSPMRSATSAWILQGSLQWISAVQRAGSPMCCYRAAQIMCSLSIAAQTNSPGSCGRMPA